MKKSNKLVLGTITLSIVALLAISAVSAFGFGNGFANQQLSEEEQAQLQEEHAQIQTAIENNDYESWKALMQTQLERMQTQITQENFNSLVERHQNMEQFRDAMEEARASGDYSQVEALREEYGMPEMGHRGMGKGSHQGGFGTGDCLMDSD